jgi:hypothetical protein
MMTSEKMLPFPRGATKRTKSTGTRKKTPSHLIRREAQDDMLAVERQSA